MGPTVFVLQVKTLAERPLDRFFSFRNVAPRNNRLFKV